MRRDFHADLKDASGAEMLNIIDDLTTFLHEPKLTPAAQAAYFQHKLGMAGGPHADYPELQSWPDYPAFIRLVWEIGRNHPITGEYEQRLYCRADARIPRAISA